LILLLLANLAQAGMNNLLPIISDREVEFQKTESDLIRNRMSNMNMEWITIRGAGFLAGLTLLTACQRMPELPPLGDTGYQLAWLDGSPVAGMLDAARTDQRIRSALI